MGAVRLDNESLELELARAAAVDVESMTWSSLSDKCGTPACHQTVSSGIAFLKQAVLDWHA